MRLLLIIGPPVVGKMTVGREIACRGGFRLFSATSPWSDGTVRELDRYRLNTDQSGAHPVPADDFGVHARTPADRDTSQLTATVTADRVVAWLDESV